MLHTELAPYSLFERGAEKWVEVKFERPVGVPGKFWVALDSAPTRPRAWTSATTPARAASTRASACPAPRRSARFGGDWMIEAVLEK